LSDNNNNFRLATMTAAVSGVFSIVVCALLIYDYARRGNGDPLDNMVYQTIKAALAKQPDNEALKTQIRDLDLHLRREYFRQRAFAVVGAGLLLGGVAIFLVSIKTAAALRRVLPHPQAPPSPQDFESQWTRIGRWAVTILALAMASLAIVLIINIHLDIPSPQSLLPVAEKKSFTLPVEKTISPLPLGEKQPSPIPSGEKQPSPIPSGEKQPSPLPSGEKQPSPIPSGEKQPSPLPSGEKQPSPLPLGEGQGEGVTPPTDEEIANNWPSFRGPGGSGISAYENIPTEWDASSGKNIRWRTPVPLSGNNSPIVWKDRVFLTGADENRREVYCFDAAGGKLLWQKEVPGTPQSKSQKPDIKFNTGFASPTAATDGRRVFAIFANGDLAAYDVNGKLVWSKSLGLPDNAYGHASSLAMYKNLLLVQFDQGSTENEEKSKLFAFDTATGNPVWQAERPVRNSWPSPIVIHAADRDQIITASDPLVISYDPKDGREIWRARCLGTNAAPSPVFARGKVFVAQESAALSAIRADGNGDVTATHVVWKAEDGLPDICSPLAGAGFVFLLDSQGTLTCYDAEKGEQLWAEDFDEGFKSSPGMAGKFVYLFAITGKAWVLEPTREKCRRAAENNLGEECVACPAFQDGCFYIRGDKHLICVGKKL
jgi:outer membrane protein assembly factor BamB